MSDPHDYNDNDAPAPCQPGVPGGATTPSPTSPFLPGSCMLLAEDDIIGRWVDEVAGPIIEPWIDEYDVDPDDHETSRQAVMSMAEEALAATLPEPCRSEDNPATRRIRVLLLCEIVVALVLAGKLDEELEDALAMCNDPDFDPWANGFGGDSAKHNPVRPLPPPAPIPGVPQPTPSAPWLHATDLRSGPVEEVLGRPLSVPRNLRVLATQAELSNASVLRLLEGQQADGQPLPVNVRRWVILVADPRWPGVEDAHAMLEHFARANPEITFAAVSYDDTHRHFGLPEAVDELVPWVLVGASPDGFAFPEPITSDHVGEDSPNEDAWGTILAYAGGFVGSPSRYELRTPERFGEILLRGLIRFRGPVRRRRVGRRWRSRPSTSRNRRPWIGG